MTLHMVSSDKVDMRTHMARHNHPVVYRWLPTQYWAWEGGDAIVVLAGHCPDVTTWVVLRLGNTVEVLQAQGIVPALKQLGFPTCDLKVA